MNFSNLFRESELLRPSVLLILGTLFLLAISAYLPHSKALSIIILGILAFILGEKLGRKFNPQLKISLKSMYIFGLVLFLISLAALYLSFFTAGGIPLLNPATRRFLNPWLTYTSFLIVPATLLIIPSFSGKRAKFYTIFLMLISAGLMALLGFRTEVLAAIIAATFTAYYCKIFDFKELVALSFLALIAFTGVTYLRMGTIAYSIRATETLAAFDLLVSKIGLFGLTHGYVQFADFLSLLSVFPTYGGRVLVSTIVGGRTGVSITSTLFGPPYADFGLLGSIVLFYFGLVLGAGYKAAKKAGIYAASHGLLLTFLLLSIETGIVDMIVWLYFGFITLLYLISHNYEK